MLARKHTGYKYKHDFGDLHLGKYRRFQYFDSNEPGNKNQNCESLSPSPRITFQPIGNAHETITAQTHLSAANSFLNESPKNESSKATSTNIGNKATTLNKWKVQNIKAPRQHKMDRTTTRQRKSSDSSSTSNSWSSEDLEPHLIQVFYPDGPQDKIFTKKSYRDISSKVGSFENNRHKPAGGNIAIFHQPVSFSQTAKSKVNSISKYEPKGGNVKIYNETLRWKSQSKVGSLENNKHRRGGGNVKILSESLDFRSKAVSRVESFKNNKHVPAGGNVNILNQPINLKSISKVGSLSNISHKSQPSKVLIFDEPIAPRKDIRPRIDSRGSFRSAGNGSK